MENYIIFLKSNQSTYYLDENGWSDGSIGTWNPKTRVAKLIKDITQTIEIRTNYVKLDGLRDGNIKFIIFNKKMKKISNNYFVW